MKAEMVLKPFRTLLALSALLSLPAWLPACSSDDEEGGTQCCALQRFCSSCSTCDTSERSIGDGGDETACKQINDGFIERGRYCHVGNDPPRHDIEEFVAACVAK